MGVTLWVTTESFVLERPLISARCALSMASKRYIYHSVHC